VLSLGGAERATRDVLKEFLGAYGKVPDAAKEVQRLGQMHRESTTGIIADYGLPLTVEQYSEAIYPLYMKRFGSFFREPIKSAAVHHDCTCPSRLSLDSPLLQVAKRQPASRS
jgi:hypothetical protein